MEGMVSQCGLAEKGGLRQLGEAVSFLCLEVFKQCVEGHLFVLWPNPGIGWVCTRDC